VTTPRRRADAAGGLEKGRRPDAVAIATERLRQMIVTGEIRPGSELSQVKLAEMTGVSTTPVREYRPSTPTISMPSTRSASCSRPPPPRSPSRR
jgi:hypothetical protein